LYCSRLTTPSRWSFFPIGCAVIAIALRITVLLQWCEACSNERGQHLNRLTRGLARRAEIDQNRCAVITNVEIRRLDASMNEAFEMHERQTFDDRSKPCRQELLRDADRPGFEQHFQVPPLFEIHDHVGGLILLEHRLYTDDIGMIEACQRLRLGNETCQTPFELGLALISDRADRQILITGG